MKSVFLRALLLYAAMTVSSSGAAPLAASERDAERVLAAITGRVTEAGSSIGLPNAIVSVEGLPLTALTDAQGRYRIANVPAGVHQLKITLLGYADSVRTVTVPAEGTLVVNFAMTTRAIALDAVLVTGTAGRQERRAQGATIANVSVAQVNEVAPVTNVSEVLQARVPGVSLTQGSGVAGTGQQIRIRGASSISLSNEPLVYVDGVRVDTKQTSVASGAVLSALNDINPDEIESIEIVKGPAAATLYGADASAGVIQIITKRGAAGTAFRQTFSLGASQLSPEITPLTNFGVCRAQDLTIANGICEGLAVGAIVSDRPMERYGLPESGDQLSLSWTTRGGGNKYGFFSSVGYDKENGLFPNSMYERITGRVNYNMIPADGFRVEFNFPIQRTGGDFPVTAGSSRGWTTGGWAGTPLTVGTQTDGWFATNRTPEAISAIEHTVSSIRLIPDIKINWDPNDRVVNRLTLGSDISLSQTSQFFPKNSNGWYSSQENRGQVTETRRRLMRFTLNYLGTVRLPISEAWGSSLSLGSEIQADEEDETFAFGSSLTTNSARSVSAAAQVSGGQILFQDRRIGFFGQWEPNYRERLYLQFGLRADRFAAFGSEAPWFMSPSVRASYVISDEAFWNVAWMPSLRIRAAYGTTGRAPNAGAALRTFTASPFLTGPNQVSAGVVPLNPGNPNLEAERGQEFEAGFDAGLLNERVGLEVTFYNKVTKNLILQVPQPPSVGFVENPYENIGEVLNRGIEVNTRAQLMQRDNAAWELRAGFATLKNEVIDLGGVAAFNTIRFATVNRVTEGQQVGAFFAHRIRSVNEATGVATVSDTLEFVGNLLPTFEANVSSTLTLFKNFRIYAQVDTKQDFMLYNATAVYRERNFQVAENWIRRNEVLSPEERISRFGPFVTESGNSIGAGSVLEEYIEPADFIRLNEVSLTYTLPDGLAERFFRAAGASVTLSGRNLAMWTDYSGFSPDIQNEFEAVAGRADFFTLPPARRLGIRLDLSL